MSLFYTRNKKIIRDVALLLILVGVGFILFLFKKDLGSISFKKNLTETQKNIIPINNKDSDGDGLKNWEEALWKTDPNNPDTDGDGVSDGEEIKTNRDPTIPGPNDKTTNIADRQKEYSEGGPLNATDRLARDFFSNFIILYESGELNAKNKKILLDKITEKNTVTFKRSAYTEADMNIVPNNNDSLKEYSVRFNKILSRNENNENEFIILQRAMLSKKEEDLIPLQKTISIYDQISKEMLGLPTPKEIASILDDVSILSHGSEKGEAKLPNVISGLQKLDIKESSPFLTKKAFLDTLSKNLK